MRFGIMDDGSIRLCIVFVILVIFSAYFGATESAYSSVNKITVKARAEDGDKKSKKVLGILNDFDRAIVAILIGTNVVHIAAASVATVFAARLFTEPKGYDPDVVAIVCTFVTTAIVFLFGEMIPKSLANDRCESISRAFAGSLRFLMKILTPLVAFFSLIIKFAEKIFAHKAEPTITEDDLYDIIDTVEEEGVMDEEQTDMLKSAMEFSETTAADIMTVAADVTAIDISLSNKQILDAIKTTNHSRLPVYDGNINDVIGYLQIRQFLREYFKNPNFSVKKILVPPFFVSPSAKIDDLMKIMREHRFYLAVVRNNETGDTDGIVTIEDFLEELVGEIWDEDDVVDDNFIKLGGNRFRISTGLPVGQVFERMGCRPPDKHIANRPVIAWVIETVGHMPQPEESFIYRNLEIKVDEVENGRVYYVEIKVNPESDDMLVPLK